MFVCDVHMGGLARRLRMLGFDAWFSPTYGDDELVAIALDSGRILLSKDRLLIARLPDTLACRVVADAPREQLIEIMRRYSLAAKAAPLTRCLECNGALHEASPEAVSGKIPAGVLSEQACFRECPDCGRVYWEGSHYQRMRAFVGGVLADVGEG